MILTSGCFDGLHAGHVQFLRHLHAVTGQAVLVAVAPDAYIRTVKQREPRFPEAARCEAVRGLRYVADVLLHGPDGVGDVLSTKPWKAFAKGMDRYGTLPQDIVQMCQARGIALLFVDSGSLLHSSSH